MKKRIGVLFCALLAMVALTLSFALPASAADDTFVIGVYYYDADGNSIKTNQYLGELPEYFGGSLTHAQQVIDDIHTHAPLFNAARTEIRLFADVPTALTIPANTTTTLNLNGFTLSAADGTAPLTVAEGGALTIPIRARTRPVRSPIPAVPPFPPSRTTAGSRLRQRTSPLHHPLQR